METAFLTTNPLKFYTQARNDKGFKGVFSLFKNLETVINTILIGNTLVNVSVGILFLLLFLNYYDFAKSVALSALLTTPLILVFGEIIPKSFSLKYSTFLIRYFSPVLRFFIILFAPLAFLLKKISSLVVGKKEKEDFITREEIEFLFYKDDIQKTSEDEKDFIYRSFKLSDVMLKEIMIPLNQVVMVEAAADRPQILEKINQSYFSRLPVYEKDVFNLIGYVQVKNILFDQKCTLNTALESALFFPETKSADKTLFEMQKAGKPLAFVVDEYGAVSGMITKEDLAELIVGNIEDEIHKDDVVIKIHDGYIVSGRESIDFLNQAYGFEIVKEGFETLSGFIAHRLGKIPDAGDSFHYKGYLYIVTKTHNRIADRVKIIEKGQA